MRRMMFAALALSAAACAPGPDPATYPADMDRGVVVVDNTQSTIADATIFLVPEHGTRVRLGDVMLNREKRFPVVPMMANRYRLVADLGTDELWSRWFTFNEGRIIEWDMPDNQVRYLADVSS